MEIGKRRGALRSFLVFSTIPILGITVLRILRCWGNDAYLGQVSGVWIALAGDLCHGVFYRPLFGPLGYGGTRYFPLVFMLQAGLMKLGGGPILTGYLLSLAATLGLMAGVYVLLRRLGVDRLLAGCSSIFILCSESTQLALLSIRGDVLPAALVVWGLVACCGTETGTRQLAVAAIFFTLAFSAKVTAVYGMGAAFLFFWLTGRRRQAWMLAALSTAGFALVAGGMLIGSHGRVLNVMLQSATAGAPWTSIFHIPQRFALYTGHEDPGGFPFLLLAAAALLAWPQGASKGIALYYFLFAGAMILIIFGTNGTDYNHLIDLHTAAVVLLAVWISRSDHQHARFGLAALAIVSLMSFFPAARNWHRGLDTISRRQGFKTVLQIVGKNPKPILADNPWIPVLAGQSPYVQDPFIFSALNLHRPGFADALWKKLQEKQFSAVVTILDPNSPVGKRAYANGFFGAGFRKNLLENYKLAVRMKDNYIFLPRRR